MVYAVTVSGDLDDNDSNAIQWTSTNRSQRLVMEC